MAKLPQVKLIVCIDTRIDGVLQEGGTEIEVDFVDDEATTGAAVKRGVAKALRSLAEGMEQEAEAAGAMALTLPARDKPGEVVQVDLSGLGDAATFHDIAAEVERQGGDSRACREGWSPTRAPEVEPVPDALQDDCLLAMLLTSDEGEVPREGLCTPTSPCCNRRNDPVDAQSCSCFCHNERLPISKGVKVEAGVCCCAGGPCEVPEEPSGCANPTTGELCRFLGLEQAPDMERCLRCSNGVLDARLGGMCGDYEFGDCPKGEGGLEG